MSDQTTVDEQVAAAEGTEPAAEAPAAAPKRTRQAVTVAPEAVGSELPADETNRGGADTSQWDAALATMDASPGVWFKLAVYGKRASATGRAKDMNEKHGGNGYEFKGITSEGEHRLYGRKVA